LNPLMQEVLELTRPRWRDIPQSRGTVVQMQTDFTANLAEVTGNPSELREALTNLILNAVDAMPGGGTLLLRTRVSTWSQGNTNGNTARIRRRVIIEVCDNGIGMDEETRRRCLEPFFSTKGKRGTGLGLAMVYGVMERHERQHRSRKPVGPRHNDAIDLPRAGKKTDRQGPPPRRRSLPHRCGFCAWTTSRSCAN